MTQRKPRKPKNLNHDIYRSNDSILHESYGSGLRELCLTNRDLMARVGAMTMAKARGVAKKRASLLIAVDLAIVLAIAIAIAIDIATSQAIAIAIAIATASSINRRPLLYREGATAMASARAMYMAVAMAWVRGRNKAMAIAIIMAKAMAS